MIKIFYGMSGTFKYTTMTEKFKNDYHILSDIKPYWKYRQELFPDTLPGTDGDFVIQRLLTLKNVIPLMYDPNKDICIERGVTDSVMCMINNHAFDEETIWNDKDIEKIVEEELKMLPKGEGVKKILLIQKDKEFIENEILKEPNRRRYYQNIDEYLEKQKQYVDFTMKYNKIDEVIEIEDAKDYLNKLKHND